MVCLIGAMVTLPAGFVQMIRALERGGYGTSSNTIALAVAGTWRRAARAWASRC